MNNLNNTIKLERQSNLELLRIISMLFIVLLHFLGHGGILDNLKEGSAYYYLYWSLEGIAYIAVNCYVLLSGYFLIKSTFKLKKLILLILQIKFYSIGIFAILVLLGNIKFSLSEFVSALFPYVSIPFLPKYYWFAAVYIGMYIISPFLNHLIYTLTKQQHQILIFVLIFISSYIGDLTYKSGGNSSLILFVCLYTIAAYIRLYCNKSSKSKNKILLYALFAILVPISKFMIDILNAILNKELPSSFFYRYNSLFVLIASITFFMLFINLNINNIKIRKLINLFASLTFGVYLIHDNRLLREVLWSFVNAPAWFSKPYSFLLVLIGVLMIYFICSFIEYARKTLFSFLRIDSILDIFSNCVQNGKLKSIWNLAWKNNTN